MNLPSSPALADTLAPWPAPLVALDPAAGLERLMGDRTMYLRVLARFRSDHAGKVTQLRAALAAGDATLAHRIAHTLKGAAAMIEARGLHALALETEQLLRTDGVADALLLARLETALARVIAEVDLLLGPATGVAASGEAVLADADLARLRALLDVGDSSAEEVVAQKHAGLHARLGTARMAELESAVAAFDYERALALLNAA